jgi:hypothetical protein
MKLKTSVSILACALLLAAAPAGAQTKTPPKPAAKKQTTTHTFPSGAGLNGPGTRIAIGVGGPGVPYGGDIGVNAELGVTPQVGLTAGVGTGTTDGLSWSVGARFYPWGFYPLGQSGLSISPHLLAMYGVVDGDARYYSGYWHDRTIYGLTAGGGARVPVLSRSFVDLDLVVVLTDNHPDAPWPDHNRTGDLLLSLGFGWKL